MSESKQEARLPEKVQHELDWLVDRLRDYGVYDRELHVPALRSSILVALDEARDEALEKAAHVCDNASTILFAEQMHRNHGSDTAIKIGSAIRALKSKRRA